MINIFLDKSFTKCDGENCPRLIFFKKSKLSISLDKQSEVSYCLILLCVQIEDYQNIRPFQGRHTVICAHAHTTGFF